MLVRDLIAKADVDAQTELVCAQKAEYEKPYDKEKVKNSQKEFINMLLSLTPNVDDSNVIVFEKGYDNYDDEIEEMLYATMYERKDIKKYLDTVEGKTFPIEEIDETMSAKEAEKLTKSLFDAFPTPTRYGFEFSEWEDILGWSVYEENIQEFGLQKCIHELLHEMSFNGMTREQQEKRRKELEESTKELKEIQNLPEEERKEYLHTLEDLFELF